MSDQMIHDMVVLHRDMEPIVGGHSWKVLSFEDHLLRRFGSLHVIRLEPDHQTHPRIREIADEIVYVLDGKIQMTLRDVRSESPTQGGSYDGELSAGDLILVPFGVQYRCCAINQRSTILRVSTHGDNENASDL